MKWKYLDTSIGKMEKSLNKLKKKREEVERTLNDLGLDVEELKKRKKMDNSNDSLECVGASHMEVEEDPLPETVTDSLPTTSEEPQLPETVTNCLPTTSKQSLPCSSNSPAPKSDAKWSKLVPKQSQVSEQQQLTEYKIGDVKGYCIGRSKVLVLQPEVKDGKIMPVSIPSTLEAPIRAAPCGRMNLISIVQMPRQGIYKDVWPKTSSKTKCMNFVEGQQ